MARLAQRVQTIHTSPIRRVAALLDETRERSDIISFGGGAPSLPPPREFIEEFTNLAANHTLTTFAYTGTRGIPLLREAVAEDVKKYGKVDFDPQNEIIITTGATESIFSTLMCLINPGDEAIITDPNYLGYKEMIELARGQPKAIPVGVENGYQPTSEQLKASITKKTKVVMLLSPDNPTGRIVNESFVKTLVDLANEYDFWIISDDAYKHIIYEGQHAWVCHNPDAKEHTITVCSFSKEAGVPGLRLGYTLAPKQVIDAIEKMQQYSTLAPESIGQFALVKFIKRDMKERYVNDSISVYGKRRDFMGAMINQELPLARTIKPAGAYYYFLDMRSYLSKLHMTEEEFAQQLLNETKVAVIPGRFFGEHGKGHVRMTFVTEPEERIKLGLERMAQFLNTG